MRFKIKYFDFLSILMTFRIGTNKINNAQIIKKIIISFINLLFYLNTLGFEILKYKFSVLTALTYWF